MTARLGGFWDSMLGEGRRWWITANSDSHVNWREGGSDFWPGEYSKTYVWAERNHDAILEGLRSGRIFVTTGDLISELYVTARAEGQDAAAQIGGQLDVRAGSAVQVTVRFLDPVAPNHRGHEPNVSRVDLIAGDVTGLVSDRATDKNPTTRVVARFGKSDWESDGPYTTFTFRLDDVSADGYLRVRGTGGSEHEPEPDPRGEDPWTDLWFYSNPIFGGRREEQPQVGPIDQKQRAEEDPARDQQKGHDHHIGDGRIEETAELAASDGQGHAHGALSPHPHVG